MDLFRSCYPSSRSDRPGKLDQLTPVYNPCTRHTSIPVRGNLLSICLINPWSICNKAASINDFITEHEIDILAITETWLTGSPSDDPVISTLLPNGYRIIHTPRGSRGGGIAVVYRQSLSISRVDTSCRSFEVLECLIQGPTVVRMCVVYQPHRTIAFIDEFSDYISDLMTRSSGHLIVLGDFNIHVDDNNDVTARDFISTISSLGMMQHITGPTHRSGHTLDLVLTPLVGPLDLTCQSLDCGFKDHFAVFVTANVSKPALPKRVVTYRKTKTITQEALIATLRSSALTDAQSVGSSDVNDLIITYNSELKGVMNTLAPLKTCEITLRPDAPWFNDQIRTAKQHRRQIERLWRKTGLAVHREMYLAEKDKVNSLIDRAKQKYYNDQVTSCQGNQQQLFRLVSNLLGRSAESPLPSGHPDELVKKFSDFFVSKIKTIQNSISDTLPHVHDNIVVAQPLTHFTPITLDQLMRLLGSTQNKQCDLDPIPTQLLKLASTELCPFILKIINSSLTSGKFPDAFKTALVSPRIKKTSLDPEVLGNYRPVSNLSLLSKTLERVAAEQITTYLSDNDLLEPNQSAYRRQHSTETALLKIHTDIRQALGSNIVVLMAMLDLSSAFDTISHHHLLQSLSAIGIQGSALQWLTSYVYERSQRVMVGGAFSDVRPLTTGVAQGSVLGPMLFTVYTRTLGKLLRSHGMQYHIYADDTQIYLQCPLDDIADGIRRLEESIDAVQTWMCAHRLKLNSNKTEFLIFATKETNRRVPTCTLRIGDSTIKRSDSAKNIGVHMDSSLTCEQHVNHVCRVSYAQLKSLSKIKCFISNECLEMILHAIITTRIDYCNSLYYGANECILRKLQVLQNACARLLTNTPRMDHITPILIDLHWLPVKQRVVFKISVMTFKCVHGLSPGYLSSLLQLNDSSRTLRSRNSILLHVPFTRSHFLYSTSFSHVAPRLWNNLPFNIRSAPSLSVFKSLLKTHLFRSYYF